MRLRRLRSDERGVVTAYAAIATFFILAMFSMSYDVSRVSQAKMQTQNAADSAALEMAVWQARGLNLVQNLNDEIYNWDQSILTAYIGAGVLTVAGQATRHFYGVGLILEGAGAAITYTSLYYRFVAEYLLQPLRTFYVYASCPMGYIAAQSAAAENGAEPIPHLVTHYSQTFLNKVGIPSISIYGGTDADKSTDWMDWIGDQFDKIINGVASNVTAVGLGFPGDDFFMTLPLEKVWPGKNDLPLNTKENELVSAWLKVIHSNIFVHIGSDEPFVWKHAYYKSDNEDPDRHLPAMIWITGKNMEDLGILSSYFVSGGQDNIDLPILAYAVARAKGGNVIGYSNWAEDGVRASDEWESNHGVGADAVLVPLGDALPYELDDLPVNLFLH
ncbi:MAG: pilus assembly protein [Candidatus Pacebacteria bacterium]|nr:pilus assembly protein [Candidatus Paceibacterota bacterium]